MKKIILISLSLLIVASVAGVGYYYVTKESDYGDVRPPKDLTGIIVPPVQTSMKGKTFIVPEDATSTPSQKVVLDLVVPTTKYDYPMGQFKIEGTEAQGSLEALDNFTTSYENSVRAVPIVVNSGGSGEFFYLAILNGDNMDHVASLPIGDRIVINSVTRSGDKVTVDYLVHDREQPMAEVPSVSTTAIFDINTKLVVQEGRNPATEEVIITKNFTGSYLWKDTKKEDGKVVTPFSPEVFDMTFSTNRVGIGTDCDTASAEFKPPVASTTGITFTNFEATKKVCHSDQEDEYFAMIKNITDFAESKDGTLTFTLSDKSKMTFEPKVKKLEFESTTTSASSSDNS